MPKVSADEYRRLRDQAIDAVAPCEDEGHAANTVGTVAERVTFGRTNISATSRTGTG